MNSKDLMIETKTNTKEMTIEFEKRSKEISKLRERLKLYKEKIEVNDKLIRNLKEDNESNEKEIRYLQSEIDDFFRNLLPE